MSDFECFIHFPKPTGMFEGFRILSIEIQLPPRGTKKGEKFAVEVK